jgi:hypothetical protein
MKRILFVFILAVILVTGTAFADHPNNKIGIGIQGRWHTSLEGGAGYSGLDLSLKVPSMPIFWAIGLSFSGDHLGFSLTGDKYFIDKSLIKEAKIDWHAGLGGWISLTATDDNMYVALGARIPIGIHWHPAKEIELWLTFAPSLGIQLTPEPYFPAGGWPIELGIRLWM